MNVVGEAKKKKKKFLLAPLANSPKTRKRNNQMREGIFLFG